jgi:hypothetical protein
MLTKRSLRPLPSVAARTRCRRGESDYGPNLVENLNRWFAANALRADLCRALAIVPLVLIGLLVVIA